MDPVPSTIEMRGRATDNLYAVESEKARTTRYRYARKYRYRRPYYVPYACARTNIAFGSTMRRSATRSRPRA